MRSHLCRQDDVGAKKKKKKKKKASAAPAAGVVVPASPDSGGDSAWAGTTPVALRAMNDEPFGFVTVSRKRWMRRTWW